jgi:hypothetical protein
VIRGVAARMLSPARLLLAGAGSGGGSGSPHRTDSSSDRGSTLSGSGSGGAGRGAQPATTYQQHFEAGQRYSSAGWAAPAHGRFGARRQFGEDHLTFLMARPEWAEEDAPIPNVRRVCGESWRARAIAQV